MSTIAERFLEYFIHSLSTLVRVDLNVFRASRDPEDLNRRWALSFRLIVYMKEQLLFWSNRCHENYLYSFSLNYVIAYSTSNILRKYVQSTDWNSNYKVSYWTIFKLNCTKQILLFFILCFIVFSRCSFQGFIFVNTSDNCSKWNCFYDTWI